MRPKRSLGQNFLKNVGIAEKMASLADIHSGDTVVEVGPGRGMLTRVLLRYAQRVIAVEKDDLLFEHLRETFQDTDSLELIHQDILESDLEQVIPKGAKIVANLPYNIATQLIVRLTGHAQRIEAMVVMLQKEVGQRICAQAGEREYSALSVMVGAVFEASPGFIVGPNNFHPRPRVDSLVIRLDPRIHAVPREDMDLFRRVVAQAFGQRRKTLRNTLEQLPFLDPDSLSELCTQAGISLKSRPQEITPEQFHVFSRGYALLLKDTP